MNADTAMQQIGAHAGGQAEPGTEAMLFLAAFSWLAAAIHAVVAVGHLEEYLPFGALFVALAAAQIAWGLIIYQRPTVACLAAGVLLNGAVIAIWAVSRTVGLPVGPESGAPEPVGLPDLGATICELALVTGSLLVLRHRDSRQQLPTVLRQAGLVVLIFTGVALPHPPVGAGCAAQSTRTGKSRSNWPRPPAPRNRSTAVPSRPRSTAPRPGSPARPLPRCRSG